MTADRSQIHRQPRMGSTGSGRQRQRRHYASCSGPARRPGVRGEPAPGQAFRKGQECGVVESVKAASDIYAPVSGEVVAINEALPDIPEKINQDAYAAWMFKLKPSDPRGAAGSAGCGGVSKSRRRGPAVDCRSSACALTCARCTSGCSAHAIHPPHRRRRARDARGHGGARHRRAVRRDSGALRLRGAGLPVASASSRSPG